MKLPKFMVQKHSVFWMSKTVPRPLRERVGRTHIQVRLGSDLRAAKRALSRAALYADSVIQAARDEVDAERQDEDPFKLALQLRQHYLDVTSDPDHDWDEWQAPIGHFTDEIGEKHGKEAAKMVWDIATTKTTPVLALVDAWNASAGIKEVTATKRRQEIERLAGWLTERGIATLDGVTRKVAAERVQDLIADGLLASSINRIVTIFASYWRYAISAGAAKADVWAALRVKDKRGRQRRRGLTNKELAHLLASAEGDPFMHDVVLTLALSGLRVDELAHLTVDGVKSHPITYFDIAEAKTPAGVRQVPVHDNLKKIVKQRMVGKEADELLFHELTNRNPAGQLSRLGSGWFRKAGLVEMHEGRQSVISMHSIRHWVVNRLEREGIPDSTAAWLLGHERQGITLSVYSRKGPGFTKLKQAIDVIYPS